jgi:hypothetical protein
VVSNSSRVQFGRSDPSKAMKVAARGRVCRAVGCATVLSIYNDSPDCARHETATGRAGRPKQ